MKEIDFTPSRQVRNDANAFRNVFTLRFFAP